MQECVVGCGEFGAHVATHLEARGLAGAVVLNPAPSTRLEAAETNQQRICSLHVPEGATLYLVAAAGEPSGSGVLIAALAEWADRRSCSVWLTLPPGQADRQAEACAQATLLELEALRKSGLSYSCRLCEQQGDQTEWAQRIGDSLLYRMRSGAPFSPACTGVGFGIVRDPAFFLKQRWAHQVAVQAVQEYLLTPDPVHPLPALPEGLQRPIHPLLMPVENCPVFTRRWSQTWEAEPTLDSLLLYYDPGGEWHQQAREFWDHRVESACKGWLDAIAHTWRSGFATVSQAVERALEQAHGRLETEIARCERAVAEHQTQFEDAQAAAEQGDVDLAALDWLVARYLLESMRLMALEQLALAIDGILELTMDDLRARAEKTERLLSALHQVQPAPATRLAHALMEGPSEVHEQAGTGGLQLRLTRASLREGPDLTAEQLLESARGDVERFLRTRPPALDLPEGLREREAWLDSALPSLRLKGVEAMPCLCEVSPGLPTEYHLGLATRSALVQEKPVGWFPGEWTVYTETPPLDLNQLTGLRGWGEAYRLMPAQDRQGLHALPQPADGWPVLEAEPLAEVAASLDVEVDTSLHQARLALQYVLLGMATPDGTGNLVLRVPVGGLAVGQPVGGLPDLLAALGEESGLARAAADRWQQLSPRQVAGYYAVLRWFETGVLDGDRGALNPRTLFLMHQAVEAERHAVVQRLNALGHRWLELAKDLVGQLGTATDDITAAAGGWRHVKEG